MEQIAGIAYSGEAGHDAGMADPGVLEALMFGKTHGHPSEGRDGKPQGSRVEPGPVVLIATSASVPTT